MKLKKYTLGFWLFVENPKKKELKSIFVCVARSNFYFTEFIKFNKIVSNDTYEVFRSFQSICARLS